MLLLLLHHILALLVLQLIFVIHLRTYRSTTLNLLRDNQGKFPCLLDLLMSHMHQEHIVKFFDMMMAKKAVKKLSNRWLL